MAFAMITSIMSTIGNDDVYFEFDTIAPLPPILTTTTTGKPESMMIINQCPNGMFQSLTIPSFICIDRSRIITVIASGCYLCRNSTEICIVMSKLCNNHPDCPLGDDENECQNLKTSNSFRHHINHDFLQINMDQLISI
ncbi:hypothetical protein DERP_014772 [Dermatophagoides pteronyssinus]|uniref:Uncharacterized protein n=1 Tax=Dermatophagoides pteronyssinus TaxID=6956 RepID=A0ABQ8JCW1_DERPT|nr:hypothetical protein DERP_014772 [Dermatophagoides pteronyssinus]